MDVAGVTLKALHQWVDRRQLVLSSGPRIGSGYNRAHTATDVLQAAVLAELGRLGIGPRRAALVWQMAAVPNLHREAMILMAPRAGDSDLDVRVVLPGGDDGLDRDDALAAFAALNLGLLQSRVAAKLAGYAGGNAVSAPADYPHRELFRPADAAPLDDDTPIRVVIVPPGGWPDMLNLECLRDAIAERRTVLLAAANEADLRRASAVFRVLIETARPDPALH